MADPLTLLREFTKNKKPVILQNDRIIFDKVSFPRNVETAYRSRKGDGEPYTLDAIYFLLQQPRDQKYKDYLNECREHNFPRVSLIDKKTDEESKKRAADHLESDNNKAKKQKVEEQELNEEIQEAKKHFIERLDRQLKRRREDKSDEIPALPKSKFLERDAAITKGIIGRERLLRTRTTVLQSQKKHFTGIIEAVMNSHKKEEQKKKADQLKAADSRKVAYDRYQDVQEEKFWKDRLKLNEPEDFQIDTRGTFADSGRLPDVTQLQQAAKPKPTPPKAPTAAALPKPKEEKRPNVPIIIVPSALTSLITLYNARDFLGEGVFVTSLEKKNSGVKKESVVGILRKRGNVTLKYHVIDNTAKLTPKDWNNVVAVFALGAAWQFKNWYWATPVEIFNNPGFFLSYEDEEPPDSIKSWPVKILSVSKTKTKKHVAQTACVEFWKIVDHHIKTRKVGQFPPQYYTTTDTTTKKA